MKTFNDLLASIGIELKSWGFSKSSSTFYYQESGNWGLINFQKSGSSSSTEVRFTINIGIFSNALNNYFRNSLPAKPAMYSCHWQERIGHYLSPRHDKWWTVTEQTDIGALKEEILKLVNEIAVPGVKTHISDEMLIAAWQNGEQGGVMDVRIKEYLSVLLAKTGK